MTTTERHLITVCIVLAAALISILAIKSAQTRTPVARRASVMTNKAAQETCSQVLVLWYHARTPETRGATLRDTLVAGRLAADIPPTVAPDVRAAVSQLFEARSLLTFPEKIEVAREACHAYLNSGDRS